MNDFTVIDVVPAHTLEAGDQVNHPDGGVITINDILDNGASIVLFFTDHMGDSEDQSFHADRLFDLVAILDEDVDF